MIKGMIFDLDGVICSTDEYHYLAWKSLADELSIYFDKEINNRLRGISRMDSLEIILEKSNIIYSLKEKEQLASLKNERYKKLLDNLSFKDILPGISNFLKECKDHNLKIALASSSRNASYIIKKLGIENEFDYIVDPDNIINSKPAPDIYLDAAKGLGLSPKECVGVEDAQAGVDSINKSGMLSIGVGDNLIGADILVKRTDELSLSLLNR